MFGYQADLLKEVQAAGAAAAASQGAPQAAALQSTGPSALGPAAPGPGLIADRYSPNGESIALAVGVLYRSNDAQSGATVDVLLVDPAAFPSPLDLERARRELRQLQKVECPNVVRVLDQGKHSEQLYVVLEAAQGRPLDQLIAAGPLAIDVAGPIIGQVGVALGEAQKVGVIHRDIAPHNVVVADDGSVKLRGFGTAPQLKRNVFGTAHYLSPEQAAGRPVDQRSNIYSLGALLFEMLTQTTPFSGDPEALLEHHQNSEPPALLERQPAIAGGEQLQQLLQKALAKSSSRRHLTLRQFLRDLEAASTRGGGSATAAPSPAPMQSFETPLHGVTSLKGGDRPPSSEYAPLGAASGAAPEAGSTAAAAPPAPAAAEPTPQGAEDANAAALAATIAPSSVIGPTTANAAAVTVAGEMAGGARVSMKQTSEQAPLSPREVKPAAAGAQPAPAGKGKAGFRETMWFFKGEIESAMAESGEAKEAAPPETQDLADKYQDDGTLPNEEASRLSLRTGKTQMMQAVKVPSGQLPGEKMNAQEFISEMNQGRKIGFILGGVLLVAVVVGVLVAVL